MRGSALLAVVALALGPSGCAAFDLMKVRDSELAEAKYARVAGSVSPGDVDAEWMVVYAARIPCGEDWEDLRRRVAEGRFRENPDLWRPEDHALIDRLGKRVEVADHVVRQRPGLWWMVLAPGCYGFGAFADLNQNYREDDEPVASALASPDRLVQLAAGDAVEGVELVIEADARFEGSFDPVERQMERGQLRSHDQQLLVSVAEVAVAGDVLPLSDPRFDEASARIGYFEVYRFLWEKGPGVYFLEEYDRKKIPVLFVHGALGFPQQFEDLIGSLDRTKYQPWVYLYPSGASLDEVSLFLADTITSLRLRHGFPKMAVVAHSMGGLVARDFILLHHEQSVRDPVDLFVSISSPWGGVPSAAEGAQRSPFVVPSWRDVAPGSPFLDGLFFEGKGQKQRRGLPGDLRYRLLFSVNDQTIPVSSAVRWEALRDADDRWPLAYGHVDVLRSPEAAELLSEALDATW